MKKNEILEKSLELFATQGYFGTSMDDIAKAVSIKKASLYSHFPGKESIFAAVFDAVLADYSVFIDKTTAYEDDTHSHEILRKIFFTYIKNCINNNKMTFWDRYYYYPPEYLKDYILEKTYEVEMAFMDKITAIIREGIDKHEIVDKNASDIALTFYNIMIGFAMGIRFYDNKDIDTELSRCLNVFLDGIMPGARPGIVPG
jgi:AcrR family transcriptional regulator